jgi:hypothetical protein
MKTYERDPCVIERSPSARFTFSISIHGDHAWELLLEDNRRFLEINEGCAADDPEEWEEVIMPVLKQFFRIPSYASRQHQHQR